MNGYTERTPGRDARPLRVAIVGAGPAAFYTAEALLKSDLVCSIDMFNRFPAPYGLVRAGVAPDHQSIKAVTRVFDRVAADPRVRYFGNVTFGTHLRRADLKPLYDQIVYATGAPADRRMGIPGEELRGSLPATAFVGWYNGHLDYRGLSVDLSHERAVVVGNGNVAIDVARILVKSPDELAKTDIADEALAHLYASRVREVVVLGRRGPAQASFTPAELRELGEMPGVAVVVNPEELILDEQSAAAVAADRTAAKNMELLRGYAARRPAPAERAIRLRFLVSPVEICGAGDAVAAVRVEHNRLVMDGNGRLRAEGAGRFETIEAGLVLRSVGYRGVPLPDVPFDAATATIANRDGRVIAPETGELLPGEYVVGWARRGPSGVIGTNKPDAHSAVEAMKADLPTLPAIPDENRDRCHIEALLHARKPDYVTYSDWQRLDHYEREEGVKQGRPRVKLTNVAEILRIVATGRAEGSGAVGAASP